MEKWMKENETKEVSKDMIYATRVTKTSKLKIFRYYITL